MVDDTLFENAQEFASHLRILHNERRNRMLCVRFQRPKRQALSPQKRQAVFAKTGGRCHICGGAINTDGRWDADHILAHAQGGVHSADNYLPAHAICNHYRWFYGTEEFQWILKIGVWFRTQIEEENGLALDLAERFVRYESRRSARRKN